MARHCAHHGLKDPEGYFDSEDEEVQEILSQFFDPKEKGSSKEVDCVRDTYCSARSATTNFKLLNARGWSHESESIERVSDPEEMEDEVFMGYFAVNGDGNERPITAPRRLIGRPTANQEIIGTTDTEVAQSSRSGTNEGVSKSGEVRGFRISLSTDSKGRNLPLIPPGSDRSSM